MREGDGGPLKVAMLGCGVVGSEVVRLFTEQAGDLAARVGRPLELAGIAVRRPGRARAHLGVDPASVHRRRGGPGRPRGRRCGHRGHRRHRAGPLPDPHRAGGTEPPSSPPTRRCWPRTAPTLFTAADKHGGDLYYEAAVAGAIPLLRPLRESLAGDKVRRVLGIVNGTTNYILTRMTESGAGFAEALEEAQALGYAEADPTADVEGFDAAAKAAILASIAFHTRVTVADVHREGIADVTSRRHRERTGDGLRGQAARHRRASRRTAWGSASAPTPR